jgi:hypothetical protein
MDGYLGFDVSSNGERIRCRLCNPPGLLDDTQGWIQRRNSTKHLSSTAHTDALASQTNRTRDTAITRIRDAQAAILNRPDHPEQPPASPPWMVGDMSHMDTNGVELQDFANVQFSAGGLDDERRLRRSKALLEKYGVEEIVPNNPTFQDDDSLSSLPRQVLASCEYG